jgi:hypothetical protein
MPIARSKPPVPPNTSLLFGHNATALLPHRASYRRNIRLRIGQRAYSDRLLGHASIATTSRYLHARPEKSSGDYLAICTGRKRAVRRRPPLAIFLTEGSVAKIERCSPLRSIPSKRPHQCPHRSRPSITATLPGLPATVAPIDRLESGLPIGIQIIGPYLEDRHHDRFCRTH